MDWNIRVPYVSIRLQNLNDVELAHRPEVDAGKATFSIE